MNATVREWVEKAEEDFHVLERESRVRKNPSFNGICFHAQQCVEKLMKAWIISKKRVPPRTHDLLILNELLMETGLVLKCSRSELRSLSIGAVMFRYPGESADKEMAVEAGKLCKRVRKELHLGLGVIPAPARKPRVSRKK